MLQRSNESPRKKNILNRNSVTLFKIIGVFIPIIILLSLELTLRIFQYGNNLNLFVESSKIKNYLVLNPDASKKYFSNQWLATTGESEPFRKKKETGTIRIFVLGESTTIGYPYFHNGSFHRWLQYRLMFTCPDKKFEIINISFTAVNSHTIHGFAKEVVNYEPDAILIYTGHNEYYGCMGVASTDKIAGNSFVINLMLNLRELRLIQFMSNMYAKITDHASDAPGGTRMKMMVADSHIPYNSDLYKRGIEQFRNNMDRTLALFNKHHIPLFISNLVSNEKDLVPFVSITNDSSKFAEFENNFNKGIKDVKNNNLISAGQNLNKANQICSGHALCNYELGLLSHKSGDLPKAKEYFNTAKELDGLRFRAPEQLNVVIEQLCQKYPNTHLVDTKGEFEKWSKGEILGTELILDHIHPNLTGYALMSQAFYDAMEKETLFNATMEKSFTFQQLLDQMPVTKVDSLVGAYRMSFLKKSWPFNEALQQDSISISSEEEKLAWSLATNKTSWQIAMEDLTSYYTNNQQHVEAGKVWEALALEYPLNALFCQEVAMINSNLNDYPKALVYFKRAFDLEPSFEYAQYIFAIHLKFDLTAEAIPYLDYAIENNNSGIDLGLIKSQVQEIIMLKNLLSANSTDLSVINKIAYNYLKMGNTDGAKIYLDQALRIDSENSDATVMLRQINIKVK